MQQQYQDFARANDSYEQAEKKFLEQACETALKKAELKYENEANLFSIYNTEL